MSAKLHLEHLEDRLLLAATFTWKGPANGDWGSASNWTKVPAGGTGIPGPGDTVQFTMAANNLTSRVNGPGFTPQLTIGKLIVNPGVNVTIAMNGNVNELVITAGGSLGGGSILGAGKKLSFTGQTFTMTSGTIGASSSQPLTVTVGPNALLDLFPGVGKAVHFLNAAVTVQPKGSLDLARGTLFTDGATSITTNGTVNVAPAANRISGGAEASNAPIFTIGKTGFLVFDYSQTVTGLPFQFGMKLVELNTGPYGATNRVGLRVQNLIGTANATVRLYRGGSFSGAITLDSLVTLELSAAVNTPSSYTLNTGTSFQAASDGTSQLHIFAYNLPSLTGNPTFTAGSFFGSPTISFSDSINLPSSLLVQAIGAAFDGLGSLNFYGQVTLSTVWIFATILFKQTAVASLSDYGPLEVATMNQWSNLLSSYTSSIGHIVNQGICDVIDDTTLYMRNGAGITNDGSAGQGALYFYSNTVVAPSGTDPAATGYILNTLGGKILKPINTGTTKISLQTPLSFLQGTVA